MVCVGVFGVRWRWLVPPGVVVGPVAGVRTMSPVSPVSSFGPARVVERPVAIPARFHLPWKPVGETVPA